MKSKLINYFEAPTGIITLTFEPSEGPHSILCGRAADFPGIGPDSQGGTFDIGIIPPAEHAPDRVIRNLMEGVEAVEAATPIEPPPGGWPPDFQPVVTPFPVASDVSPAPAPGADANPAPAKAGNLPKLAKP